MMKHALKVLTAVGVLGTLVAPALASAHDWDDGPRWERHEHGRFWDHERWEHERWEHRHFRPRYYQPYYYYNYGYSPYQQAPVYGPYGY